MELLLPTQTTMASHKNPRKLFLFSHTKSGKSSAASMLPNNLIVDLENGSSFLDGMIFNVKEEAKKAGISGLSMIKELVNNIKKSDLKYDYITLDTATALEDYASELATILYKQTPIGKNFQGRNVVTELPQGAGYGWLRIAFEEIYNLFDGLATKGLIILGHVKNSSISKDGKELSVRDINLTGKLKMIISADVDAIGFLYRNPQNQNELMVSFKTDEMDVTTGARSPHLRQQEFVLTEYNAEKDTFVSHWDKIFV